MGKLRLVPKQKEPGFISITLDDGGSSVFKPVVPSNSESNLSIKTRRGTVIRVGVGMPLKQVARLVRMLEGGAPHGLG